MSSSLRNAVKRKTHKERAQPAGRKKYGLLEKHKDYQLRAKDYHRKKKQLDALRRKAELRNVDEFYFGMTRAKTEEGVHKVQREGPEYKSRILAENFDKGYLQTKLTHEKNQLEKLQSNLHFVGVDPSLIDPDNVPKKTVFVDSESEAEAFDEAEYFETAPELLDAPAHLRKRLDELRSDKISSSSKSAKTEKAYAELLRRQKRVEALSDAVQHLQVKHDLRSTKGKRRKVKEGEDGKPAVYVWKSERLR